MESGGRDALEKVRDFNLTYSEYGLANIFSRRRKLGESLGNPLEQQENVNRELYQAISDMADRDFSAEKLTDVIFEFYKMTEKMPILKLLDIGEVELLARKLPREIVEEHFQDDTDTIEKMFMLLPVKKSRICELLQGRKRNF